MVPGRRTDGTVWPVGSVADYIRERLDADPILGDLWLTGEVSNVFRARSGHVYFTLKDDDGQLKVVVFRREAARQRYQPDDGDAIVVHGRVSVFPRDGSLQVYADFLEAAGQGLQQLQLQLLRQQLEAEGLFATERKRPLPPFPKVIGVVTSPDGAVWHDIQNVLRRRYPLVELVLAPAKVQGEEAPRLIVEALEAVQRHPGLDLVIIARGGGSAEDLGAFNDERLARAVFACRVPVVSAVGHETDWTIIDDVADVRAPTPSAAAEICTPSRADLALEIRDALHDLRRLANRQLAEKQADLSGHQRVLQQMAPMRGIREYQTRVASSRSLLEHACMITLERHRSRLQQRRAVLQALDPQHVLNRGYAQLTNRATGSLVMSEHDVSIGDQILASVSDGSIRLAVEGRADKPPRPSARRLKPDRSGMYRPTLFETPQAAAQGIRRLATEVKGMS